MSAPRVSVIIPAYNWSGVLRFSIPSVLRQTFRDFELLVIGDACTDDSAEVTASFGDPRVRWHNLPQNSGSQAGPNNAGLEMARGEYVAYLGQDDLWDSAHLESLVEALDRTGADLAYAVAILYGPPGSGIRGVTGLLAPEQGAALRHVPPSSFMHRRDVVARTGPWRDHRTIRVPHDYDLLLRIWELRRSFVSTGRLSSFKFTTSWRPDAYRTRSTEEQAEWTRRMETEPDFRERELLDLVTAYATCRVVEIGAPADAPPGELIERSKVYKGAVAAPPPETRTARLRFEFDQAQPGLEWQGVEHDPRHGTFQWSGPATSSSLRLPLVNDRDLEITFRVLHWLAPDVVDSLRLEVNGEPVALTRRTDESGAALFVGRLPAAALALSSGAPRLTFRVSRTVSPADLDPASGDRRRLGLAFNWIEVRA